MRRRVLLMAAAILRYCEYVAITDVHDSSSCHASGREGAGGTGVAQWQQPGPGFLDHGSVDYTHTGLVFMALVNLF